jgi:cytidylate kinase
MSATGVVRSKERLVIAVDGPAASGKGTIAKRLAAHFKLPHLDTGLLYRAVGWRSFQTGEAPAEVAARLGPGDLNDPALRSDEAGQQASKVGAIPEVRTNLLKFQREFSSQPSGAVLDGRDIGTVVCPDADAKLFITASVQARADRRVKELQARGETAIYARVLQDMQERDARDQGRSISPTKPATDALIIDTSDLTADQVFERALAFIASKMKA